MKGKRNILYDPADSLLHTLFWDTFFVLLASRMSIAISKLIDSLMVSKFLGSEMFAAQSLTSPFFGCVTIVSCLLAMGSQILVSKYIAKGQFKDSDQVFSLALLVGLVISGLIMVVSLGFGDAVTKFLGASREDAALFANTKAYLMGLGVGVIPLTLNVVLSPILQINGDRKRVKFTMFFISGVNCVLNLLAIFVFKLGMLGVGLATSIAEWSGMICYLLHFRKRNIMCHIRFRGLSLGKIKEIVFTGLSQATIRACNTLRPLLVNRWTLFLSTSAAISAVGIRNNLTSFFLIPEMAVALTVMLIAGTFYEEQDKQALKKIVRISMNYNVLINAALSVLIFAFAPYWVSLYEKIGSQTHDMTVYCLRWTAVGLSFCAVNEYFMHFMMGTGKHKQVHILTFFQRFIYIVGCAFALGLIFGVKGVFASFAVAEICFTVHVVVYIWVKNKKFPTSMEQFMLLPEDFGAAPDMTLDCSVCSMDEVIGISKTVMDFCKERGMDQRRAGYAALCVEEMAANIVQHGFVRGKKQSLMIRVVISDGNLILRFRDSCRLFDIREKYESADKNDMTKNIGIRLVMKMAKDVMYINTLNLNTTIIKI